MADNFITTFIKAGNAQALPVMGISFQLGNPAAGPVYTGFFSMVDEKSLMELAGYIDPGDFMIVAGVDQFGGTAPALNSLLTYNGQVYEIKAEKSDPSSFIFYVKKIS